MPTILHVIFYTGLYGAEQSLLSLIQGLNRYRYNSVVVTYRPGPLTEKLESLNIPVIYLPFLKPWLPGVHIPAWKRRLYNLYHLPFLLYSSLVLKKIIQDYGVNLVHTTSAMIFDGALAAALAGVPHIWHIREAIESDKTYRFFLGTRIARSLILCFSSRVIAVSHAIARPYLGTLHGKHKVKVVYNGVDLNLFHNNVDTELILELGLPRGVKLIGLVGNIEPIKRQEDFLRAAVLVKQSVSDVLFLMIGGNLSAPSPYMQFLQQLSQELGIEQQVRWLGFQEKINEILALIDLLVLPSENEAFGRVIIEAMAASKPVVATQVGGIPEIVVDSVTGLLVPPRSPTELAQAIIKILKNPSLARSMGQAGRKRVEEMFTVKHYVDNIVAIYEELLSS